MHASAGNLHVIKLSDVQYAVCTMHNCTHLVTSTLSAYYVCIMFNFCAEKFIDETDADELTHVGQYSIRAICHLYNRGVPIV